MKAQQKRRLEKNMHIEGFHIWGLWLLRSGCL